MIKNILVLFALLVLAAAILTLAGTFNIERPEAREEEEVTTEKLFGFIRDVDALNGEVVFDDARWTSGKEGEDAAIAAGLCTEATREECLPNDYFILNSSTSTEAFPISVDVKLFMQTWQAGDVGIMKKEITLPEFAELIHSSGTHWGQLPYDVTIKDGEVVLIEEVYIP